MWILRVWQILQRHKSIPKAKYKMATALEEKFPKKQALVNSSFSISLLVELVASSRAGRNSFVVPLRLKQYRNFVCFYFLAILMLDKATFGFVRGLELD